MNNLNLKDPFPSEYERFIYKSRYSRWLEEEGRREEWDETVTRYLNFITEKLQNDHKYRLPQALYDELFINIYNLEVMPSMRAMMTSGPALGRDNVAGYNCSYLPVDDVKSFDEAMYILLNGTGVGFSVERQYISKLPEVPDELFDSETTVVVADSKAGWAKAYRQILALLYSGEIPKWDVSKVRPAGARLKTFGGRASGPEPLEELFRFTIDKFRGASGRRLSSIECHDLMCKIGAIVVVGGVRRSAMISLSNLTDDRMRKAKSGVWWDEPDKNIIREGQRALANNSICYTEKPDVGAFMNEWVSLYESNSGERGIFNRVASVKQAAKNGRRDTDWEFGTNPCSEIILRPYQFCNLTEVVAKDYDTIETLKRKIELATILGTFQSTLTNFPYLRKIWQKNTEEERLLGVSITGILDSRLLTTGYSLEKNSNLPQLLQELRQHAIDTNEAYAKTLGIQQSTAITCVN